MRNELIVVLKANQAIMDNGDIINIKNLSRTLPVDLDTEEEIEHSMTYAEFRQACFKHNKFYHAIFGRSNGENNGRTLSSMTRERGIEPGDAQHTFKPNGAVNKKVSSSKVYPFEVLRDWLNDVVRSEYEVPPSV